MEFVQNLITGEIRYGTKIIDGDHDWWKSYINIRKPNNVPSKYTLLCNETANIVYVTSEICSKSAIEKLLFLLELRLLNYSMGIVPRVNSSKKYISNEHIISVDKRYLMADVQEYLETKQQVLKFEIKSNTLGGFNLHRLRSLIAQLKEKEYIRIVKRQFPDPRCHQSLLTLVLRISFSFKGLSVPDLVRCHNTLKKLQIIIDRHIISSSLNDAEY